MNVEDIKQKLISGEIKLSDISSVIKTGEITDCAGGDFTYEISHGWNVITAMNCDTTWGRFNIEMLDFIDQQNFSDKELKEVLEKLSLEDKHWDWFAKSMVHFQDEYEWFFLSVDGTPEGACVIYHPKDSVIDGNNIFYIEYVATAPWNRDNPYQPKKFNGIGTILINCALDYAVNKLKLVHGFSLHSLPKAKGYYERIGMVYFSHMDKGTLSYYEMPREKAKELSEAS